MSINEEGDQIWRNGLVEKWTDQCFEKCFTGEMDQFSEKCFTGEGKQSLEKYLTGEMKLAKCITGKLS